MADNSREMELLLTINDKISKQLDGVSKKVKEANKEAISFQQRLTNMKPTFTQIRNVGLAVFSAVTAEVVLATKAFAESEKQMAKVTAILDTLSKDVVKGTGVAFDKLSDDIKKVSSSLVDLAFDDEDTAVSITKLTQATGNYTDGLRLNRLAMDLARYKGIDLESATQALIRANAGSTKELKALGIEVADNTSKQELFAEVQKRVAGQAEAYSKTLAGQTEALKIRMSNLQEAIGQALVPALTQLLDKINPVIEKITAWAEANPELLARILLVAGGIAGLAVVFGTLGTVLPAVISGVQLLGGALMWLWANPIGLIIAGVALLVAGLYLLITHYDQVKSKLIELFPWLTIVFSKLEEWYNILSTSLSPALKIMWDILSALLTKIWEWIAQITESLSPILKILLDLLGNFIENYLKVMVVTIDLLVLGIAQLADKFVWLVEKIKPAYEWVAKMIGKLKELISLGGGTGGGITSGLANVFTNPFINPVGAAMSSTIGVFTGKARGGSVTAGTPYRVGENGAEVFVPSQNGTIVPNGGMGAVIVNVYGDVTGTELINKVKEGLMRDLRINGRLSFN